jgi:hypothetical protein
MASWPFTLPTQIGDQISEKRIARHGHADRVRRHLVGEDNARTGASALRFGLGSLERQLEIIGDPAPGRQDLVFTLRDQHG